MTQHLLGFMGLFPINGLIIPIIIFMIPIVAILTAHQRRMAEIMHQQRTPIGDPGQTYALGQELDTLRREVRELKNLVQLQSASIESLTALQARNRATEVYEGSVP